MKDLLIGFDIGTSSLKLIILNENTNKIELELSKSTSRALVKCENSLFNEQDVDVLLGLVEELFGEIPNELYARVRAVQICGQMHGIVLWNKSQSTLIHSNLVTWQDLRCTSDFLSNLPVKSVSDLNSGFGCATLLWYILNNIDISKFNSSGTIHDYVAHILSNKCHVMSDQNALSWGYFDLNKMEWQKDLKEFKMFPFEILPSVSYPGTLISNSLNIFNRNLEDTSIYCSLGDLQCSVYSCLEKETDCVINISTSSQVCVSIKKTKYESIKSRLPKSLAMFPYFDDRVLLVAASLNGGNVLDHFVQMVYDWNRDMKLISSNSDMSEIKKQIWSNLIKAATSLSKENTLKCKPTIYGERHAKNEFGCLTNISLGNTSIGNVFDSICTGIITNLNEMFPADLLKNEFGIKRIVGTGKALLKNQIIRYQLESQFGLPINYNQASDAALGAAYFLKHILHS